MPRELKQDVAMAPASSASWRLFSQYMYNLELKNAPILEIARVLGPWGIWFVLRVLDWILGPKRRSSGHWGVQYGALAAYYLPTPLLFYAANAVSSFSSPALMLTFSLYNLLLLSLSTTWFCQGVITAYTLRDAPLQRWRILLWLPYILWLQVDSIRRGGMALAAEPSCLKFLVFFLNILMGGLLLLGKQWRPFAATLDCETLRFAEYMMLESCRSPAPFFDVEANNLYPIMYKDGHWVSIKDLLQCDRLQIRNCAMEARDIFLSYSLCRLLARRYYGFHCAEDGNVEVRQLTVTQPLHDYKRAFTIVDVQLAFLHDHFFTSYPMSQAFSVTSAKRAILPVLLLLVASELIALWINHVDAYFLVFNAVVGVIFGTLFLRPVVPKYWLPLRFAFLYYPRATGWAVLPTFIRRCVQDVNNHSWNWTHQPYWRDKIGQYSLIKDYDRRSPMRSSVAWLKNFMLSQVSYSFIKHHPVSEENVRVPDSVRESVARALQGIDGPPTNGSWCLQRNRDIDFNDLAWTLRQKTHTHTMIWHIATCYCDMLPPTGASIGDDDDLLRNNHGVATALSRYCAYLVAFHPELLPEHSLSTKILLQLVLFQAQYLLEGRTRLSMGEKRARIQGLELPEDDSSLNTFQKGIKLGRRLADMLAPVRWKVMAEFWAETVLYVAPSDDAAAHIERLANGGEFVTHLWAMLSNAGILKRATEEWSPTQPEPDSDIPIQEQDQLNAGPVAPVSSTVRQGLRLRRSNSLPTF